MPDNHTHIYNGHTGVKILYTPSDDGPEKCAIALNGTPYDMSWTLADVMAVINRLKDGKAVAVADTKQSVPGLTDWLITRGFSVPVHRTICPLPAQIEKLVGLYEDLKGLAKDLEAKNGEHNYIAVIRASAVRDVQYDTLSDSPPESEAWTDMPDAEIFLGVFPGDKDAVLRQASEYAGTTIENIRLIEI